MRNVAGIIRYKDHEGREVTEETTQVSKDVFMTTKRIEKISDECSTFDVKVTFDYFGQARIKREKMLSKYNELKQELEDLNDKIDKIKTLLQGTIKGFDLILLEIQVKHMEDYSRILKARVSFKESELK